MPDQDTTSADTQAAPEHQAATDEHAVEIAIEALLGFPVPPDWADPQARAQRTETLRVAARLAARMAVENQVHARLCTSRNTTVRPEDRQVADLFGALLGLHRALCAYQHDTLLYDGGEVVMNAMEDEAGAGIAASTDGLLTGLGNDLTEAMR
jgi:hypothetical protein